MSRDDDAPPRTFRHEHLTFDVPDDWVDDSIVRLRRGPKGKHPPNLVVSRERIAEDETLADVALRLLKGIRAAVGEISVIDKGAATHPELPEAYRQAYRWTVPDGGPTLVQRAYLVRYMQQAVILYGTCREPEKKEMEKVLERAFRTLHVQGFEEREREDQLRAEARRLPPEEGLEEEGRAAEAPAELGPGEEGGTFEPGEGSGTLLGVGGRPARDAGEEGPGRATGWGEETEIE